MSDRHQTFSYRLNKTDRRVEHHRERQATRSALHVSDLEDVLAPPSVHRVPQIPSSDYVRRPAATESRRLRHWKLPFWKRRTEVRHRHNQEILHPRNESEV